MSWWHLGKRGGGDGVVGIGRVSRDELWRVVMALEGGPVEDLKT